MLDTEFIPDCIHIGYPKTGSTFLQTNIFPNLPRDIYYMDKWIFDHTNFVFKHDASLPKSSYEGKTILLSSEAFLANGFADPRGNLIYIMKKIFNLNKNIKVFFVIRSQYSLFRSAYNQAVKHGYKYSFSQFIKKCESSYIYDFLNTFTMLENIFHEGNMTSFLFEDLVLNPNEKIEYFLQWINPSIQFKKSEFVEDKVKSSVDDFNIFTRFICNNIFSVNKKTSAYMRQKLLYILSVFGKYTHLRKLFKIYNIEKYKEEINRFYSQSNQELFKLLNKEIKLYNYPQ